MSNYFPTISWGTLASNVLPYYDTGVFQLNEYLIDIDPIDINEPGASSMDVNINDYFIDNLGYPWQILEITDNITYKTIRVLDVNERSISEIINYGPYPNKIGYVYRPLSDAIILSQAQLLKLDSQARDRINNIEKGVIWDKLAEKTQLPEGFKPVLFYDFNSDNVSDWTQLGCSLGTPDDSITRMTSSSTDPQFYRDINIDGGQNQLIKIRYKVISGSVLNGQVYYKTSNHSYNSSYLKYVSLLDNSRWNILELDMSNLDFGGSDWVDNTITGIRFDLGGSDDIVVDIDWIGIGKIGWGTQHFEEDVYFDDNLFVASSSYVAGNITSSGYIYHHSNINVVNKFNDGWLTWATRNTGGNEAVIDLSNIGEIKIGGNGVRGELYMPATQVSNQIKLTADSSTIGCSIVNTWANSSNAGVVVGTNRSDGIAFQVQTTIPMSNGYPSSSGAVRFVVSGDSGAANIYTNAGNTHLGHVGTSNYLSFHTSGKHIWRTYNGTSYKEVAYIDGNGNFVIGDGTTTGAQYIIRGSNTTYEAATRYLTNNSHKWFVGLDNTSDDYFRFYSYDTATYPLVITNNGNLGVGTADIENWGNGYNAIEMPRASIMYTTSNNALYINSNTYYDGSWKYKTNGKVATYLAYDGGHYFYTSGSVDGVANNVVTTLTTPMKIENTGRVVIGADTTASIEKVHIGGALRVTNASGNAHSWLNYTGSNYFTQDLTQDVNASTYFRTYDGSYINHTQVNSSGEWGFGATPLASTRIYAYQSTSGIVANLSNVNTSGYGIYVRGGNSTSTYTANLSDYNGTSRFTLWGDGGISFNSNPTSNIYYFPINDGTNNQVLTTNGSGVLSWTDKGTGGTTTGITSINSQTGTTQSIVGGSGVTVSSSGNTHTISASYSETDTLATVTARGSSTVTNCTFGTLYSTGYGNSQQWNTAYLNRITSLTTTGSSGAATLASNVLNIPQYTLAGLDGVPTSRSLTINGTAYDLSANRAWNVGTVTSVSAGDGMDFASITGGGIVHMGTPSSCSNTTPNLATSDSHTHTITGFDNYQYWTVVSGTTSYNITSKDTLTLADGIGINISSSADDSFIFSTDLSDFNPNDLIYGFSGITSSSNIFTWNVAANPNIYNSSIFPTGTVTINVTSSATNGMSGMFRFITYTSATTLVLKYDNDTSNVWIESSVSLNLTPSTKYFLTFTNANGVYVFNLAKYTTQ